MPLSTLANAPSFDRAGFTFRSLAAPSRGSSELAMWSVLIAPGTESELHSMDREEILVVMSGAISATVGGEEVRAQPGDVVIVPAGALLQIRNERDQAATVTAVTSVGMTATVGGATFVPPWAQ
ncbi:MAG: hypothetical protein QOJ11_529 [Frankiales bacterium]|jgi:quercetin dioxygenase-like cupin family protein|nr:hypothetical protein [Frankiales bacterium]